MKYKVALLLLVLVFSSFKAVHKYYVSVTEIEYNEKTGSLQIISRVFIDDFEDLLKKRYDPEVVLGSNFESPNAKEYIKKYTEQKLELNVDGKPVKLNYLGKEYENDMLVLYLEVPQVPQFKKIRVKNTILMDMFEEQKNLIHVAYKNKTKSLILSSGSEEDQLNF